ncbi:ATP-dependent helicase, partial [Bacteroides uniformis]|uniref:ATP-dependent helicase n=2 Tax=Bacteroides TaxID=816 RepID=UPI0018AB53FD
YLLENGYQPWNILALTFTNKAAREMKERIARQVGPERARHLWMGTFHSMFLRILHVEAGHIGFTSQFTIYDTADSKSLIRSIIKEMGLDEKVYKPGMVQARISNAKNHLVSPAGYANNKEAYEGDRAAKVPALRDIYQRYWERCRQADAMDFDDLLFYTFLLFRDHPEVLARYQEQFRYILVDEYQDTNFAQHSIVLQLAKNHQHVCVVGDDAQSIYSFRGADIDNILYFTKVYPDTKVFKLEQNYRSTQTIVRAANSLIEKNQWQIRKEVFSEKEKGEAIGVYQAYSDVEEGDIVVNKIAELRREKRYAYSDFAILYRTNAQSRIFEEAMRKRSMPYRIYGGLSFYQRKEIKDVIAYFRLIVNPNDEEAFKRIINYPARGIGDTTVGKIIAAATGHNVSLWTVLCEPLAYGLNFNKGTVGKLQAFRELISAFITDAAEKNAYEIGADIIRQSGIINDVCQDNSPENLSRKENIEELVNGMSDFCAQRQEEGNPNVLLGDFLSEVSLLTDQDSDKDGDDEKITLMTVHSAKGLEFKNVFVVGMEENLFPSGMVGDSPRALEEERRLFYVAITRAEEHCFLSYAKTRFRYGKMEFGSPSRFLKDIDIRFLRLPQDAGMFRRVEEEAAAFRRENARGFAPDREDAPYGGKERVSVRPKQQIIAPTVPRNLKRVAPSANTASTSPSAGGSANRVQQGQLIEHERFGLGEVLKVEGEGDNAKATIRFKNAGDKQLLLRFARFKVLS